jgi:hypothetical protein
MTLHTRDGKTAFEIDEADMSVISRYTWHFQRYLRTQVAGKIIRLHNLLLGYAQEGLEWDHIDRNPLNNRRSNLRLVTKTENMRNRGTPKNNTSGVKGVCWHKGVSKWIAQIKLSGRITHLGYFSAFDDAVAARKTAEKLMWRSDAH